MAVELEGGCFVTRLRAGAPSWEQDNLRIWSHVGKNAGSRAITLRTLELGAGTSPAMKTPSCEEVLYVISGRGRARVDGHLVSLEPNVAFHLDAERVLELENHGAEPIVLLSSQCPDPAAPPRVVPPPAEPRGEPPPIARLDDRETETTGDRWYRVMIDREVT